MSNVVKMNRTTTPAEVVAMRDEIPDVRYPDMTSTEGEAFLTALHGLSEEDRKRVFQMSDWMVAAEYEAWLSGGGAR